MKVYGSGLHVTCFIFVTKFLSFVICFMEVSCEMVSRQRLKDTTYSRMGKKCLVLSHFWPHQSIGQ